MSREKLNNAARFFIQRVLPAATGKQYSQLNNAEVLLGAYRRYTGPAVQSFGRSITPKFSLKVAPAAGVSGGVPNLGTAAVPANAADQPLIWMRFAADLKMDNEAAIRDVLGDLDTYTQRKLQVAGVDIELPAEEQMPASSQAWAAAIVANRAQIPDNLSQLTEVPAGLRSVASSVAILRFVLEHFFTYDGGTYYPRWAGAGRNIPADLSPVYREKNVSEALLERDQMYLYMLAPKSLFTTAAAEPHDYREAVLRFDETGDANRPFAPALVHCAYRRIQTPHPFHDFVFFEAEDGVGLPIPAEARPKLSSAVRSLLVSLPEAVPEQSTFLEASPFGVAGNPPVVQLMVTYTGELALPQGAVGDPASGGMVMPVLCPPSQVIPLAASPGVAYVDLSGNPYLPNMDLALTAVDYAGLRAKIPAGKQDGAGVLIGVIDTGIDGSHPSFRDSAGNTRIVAVWQQDDGGLDNPNCPAALHPGNSAYAAFRFGRELTGAQVANATDAHRTVGHGTHVAGIAAGIAVTTGQQVPRGVASGAKIVAVRAIGVGTGDPALGVGYIFQKAKELNLPCVINMSFGGHVGPHDGTGPMSRAIARQVRAANGSYLPGRILVAAAGNERDDDIHLRRDLTPWTHSVLRYQMNARNDPANPSTVEFLDIWIREKSGGKVTAMVWAQHVASGWSTPVITNGQNGSKTAPGLGVNVSYAYGAADAHNGDDNARIVFSRGLGLPNSEWRIFVMNLGAGGIEVHAWAASTRDARFLNAAAADNAVKVGSPADAFDIITVASMNTRLTWTDIDGNAGRSFGQTRLNDISSYSSPGPLRDCSNRLLQLFGITINLTHDAIDIAAPGSAILSAKSRQIPATVNRTMQVTADSLMLQGTSMASPVVTGLVAALLAAEPTLTQEQVRQRLKTAGRLPAPAATQFDPGSPDKNDWGPGLVNAPSMKP